MEVLNLIRLFWGWVFPYISRIHTAYIGEYLHFRYLKSLVVVGDLEFLAYPARKVFVSSSGSFCSQATLHLGPSDLVTWILI